APRGGADIDIPRPGSSASAPDARINASTRAAVRIRVVMCILLVCELDGAGANVPIYTIGRVLLHRDLGGRDRPGAPPLYWERRRTSFGPGPNRAAELAGLSNVRETEGRITCSIIWSVIVHRRAHRPSGDVGSRCHGLPRHHGGRHRGLRDRCSQAGSLDPRGGRSCALWHRSWPR